MSGDDARNTEESLLGAQKETALHDVVPGQIIATKYRILELLGRGGMGMVIAAEHLELHERVAIKLMLPGALGNPDAVARFLQEARAAVKIKSEHVARVLDVGRLESGEPYIVMEYLTGTDLSGLIDKNGPLPVAAAAEYLLQVCDALANAHALGIIHRDLKPANIFLTKRRDGMPLVKVLDFGISKLLPKDGAPLETGMGMTRTKQMLGTPLYMPPEQLDSARSADMTSDIWALGVILFELLTGTVPFPAESVLELRRKIRSDRTPSLTKYRDDIPAGLEEVVGRCLQKDSKHRYQNVAEFAQALAKFAPATARQSVTRIQRTIENAGLGNTLTPDSDAVGTELSLPAQKPQGAAPDKPPPRAVTTASSTSSDVTLSKQKTFTWQRIVVGVGFLGVVAAIAIASWPRFEAEPVLSPSLTRSATSPSASAAQPASPLPSQTPQILSGVWRSEAGRQYRAVKVDDGYELRVMDPGQFVRQHYELDEVQIRLRPLPDDANAGVSTRRFLVEEFVRPPIESMRLDIEQVRRSCLLKVSKVKGKRLLASLHENELRIETAPIKPLAGMFISERGSIVGCNDLSQFPLTTVMTVLTR